MDIEELATRLGALEADQASRLQAERENQFMDMYGTRFSNDRNIGLAILECNEAAEEISNVDEVEVDFDSGLITNLTSGKTYQAQPFPPFIQNIIKNGGLMNSIN